MKTNKQTDISFQFVLKSESAMSHNYQGVDKLVLMLMVNDYNYGYGQNRMHTYFAIFYGVRQLSFLFQLKQANKQTNKQKGVNITSILN